MIKYTVAVESNGSKSWWLNGKLHREDGPAVECANGDKSWWLNGKAVAEQDVMKPVKEMSVAEIEAALGHKVKVVRDKITIGGMYYE